MAIVFVQQNKKQKVLIFILIAALLVTGVVVWQGFSGEQKTGQEVFLEENTALSQDDININFEIFKNPLLKDFQEFSEIEPLNESTTTVGGVAPEKRGRENPFLPY